jgi:hypothetical protein
MVVADQTIYDETLTNSLFLSTPARVSMNHHWQNA